MVECRDGLARITLEELAITHSIKSGTLQNACSTRTRMVAVLGEKCSFAHGQVDSQPTKWSRSCDVQLEGIDSRFFEMLDAQIPSALKKIITNHHFKKKVSSRGAKGSNGRPVSPWKTYCVNDLRTLSGDWAHVAVLDDTDLFSVTLHGDYVQDSDT